MIPEGWYVAQKPGLPQRSLKPRWVLGTLGGKVRYSTGSHHRHRVCSEKAFARWVKRVEATLQTPATQPPMMQPTGAPST